MRFVMFDSITIATPLPFRAIISIGIKYSLSVVFKEPVCRPACFSQTSNADVSFFQGFSQYIQLMVRIIRCVHRLKIPSCSYFKHNEYFFGLIKLTSLTVTRTEEFFFYFHRNLSLLTYLVFLPRAYFDEFRSFLDKRQTSFRPHIKRSALLISFTPLAFRRRF